MLQDGVLDDGQPEACAAEAARAPLVDAVEAVEEVGQVARLDACAVVGEAEGAEVLVLGDEADEDIFAAGVGDGVVPLLEAGIINNKKKQIHTGRTVLGAAFGSEILCNYINNNPAVEMYPINYVNDAYVISQNDNVVSINSCLQIDLMGQVVADTMGLSQISAVGGQVDFVRGAALSKNGRSIIAMTSTAKNDTISKIVPVITDRSAITTTRNDVNMVVTEFGVAHLKGRTMRERAKELIKIAHPKFRKMLCDEYEARYKEKINIE